MTRLLRLITVWSLPLGFVAAGTGMLWLYRVRAAPGTFYERLVAHESDWVGSHLVLLAGALLVVPATRALADAVGTGRGAGLAAFGQLLAVPGAMLLAGQYAIDFVMPLIAKAGGEALTVHRQLFATEPLNTLFYVLPDFASVGLLLMTVGLWRSRALGRGEALALLVLWLSVIAGAALHVVVQRAALAVLGLAYVPTARRLTATIGGPPPTPAD